MKSYRGSHKGGLKNFLCKVGFPKGSPGEESKFVLRGVSNECPNEEGGRGFIRKSRKRPMGG